MDTKELFNDILAYDYIECGYLELEFETYRMRFWKCDGLRNIWETIPDYAKRFLHEGMICSLEIENDMYFGITAKKLLGFCHDEMSDGSKVIPEYQTIQMCLNIPDIISSKIVDYRGRRQEFMSEYLTAAFR